MPTNNYQKDIVFAEGYLLRLMDEEKKHDASTSNVKHFTSTSDATPNTTASSQATKNNSVRIPSHFPQPIAQLLPRIIMDNQMTTQRRKDAIAFFESLVRFSETTHIEVLQPLAALLQLAPEDVLLRISIAIGFVIHYSDHSAPGTVYCLHDLLHGFRDTSNREILVILVWLKSLADTDLEAALGFPYTVKKLLHLTRHVAITLNPDAETKFLIQFTTCSRDLYTPHYSFAHVKAFLDTLCVSSMENVAEEDQVCRICLAKYGEPGSLMDDLPEQPVTLGCGHTFGKSCLTVLLASKPEGRGHKECLFCKRGIRIRVVGGTA